MGLDMYLTAKRYISPYDHNEPDAALRKAISAVIGLDELPTTGISNNRVTGVDIRVAYWRKANAIHSWFVENTQNGNDECQKSSVTREQLDKLREECLDVYAHRNDADADVYAEQRLPVVDGCFFGEQVYSEYYYEALLYTAQALAPESLDMYKNCDFEYQASW